MTKKSPRITAPRLWLVIAKSYHALSIGRHLPPQFSNKRGLITSCPCKPIEAVGTRVAPAVRERLAAKSKLSETAMS
jgi:hypothetical protein